jgi:hexosaminidase
MQAQEGSFAFSATTAIRFDRKLTGEAELLSAQFGRLTGQKTKAVAEELKIMLHSEVALDIDDTLPLKVGGYQLSVTPRGIKIIGKDAEGAFWGMQTLMQLLPADLPIKQASVAIPALTISDEPEYGWRGMHLDCGRHFFPIEDLKKFIDQMAFHKLNVFHWHLTEANRNRRLPRIVAALRQSQ